MITILNITLPLFLLIGVGYGAVKLGFLNLENNKGLGSFVLNFAYPALVFNAISTLDISSAFLFDYVFVYGGITICLYWTGLFISLKVLGRTAVQSALNGLGLIFCNTAFLGYPVLAQVIGLEQAAIFLSMNLLFENLLGVLPTILLCELSSGKKKNLFKLFLTALKKIVSSPPIVAILSGIIFSLLGLGVVEPVRKTLTMLSIAAAPVALFAIGANLNAIRFRSSIKAAIPICLGKLVLFPALIFAGFTLYGVTDHITVMSGVLLASAPAATLYALIGMQYGESHTSGHLIVMTFASFFSLSTVLVLWNYFYGFPNAL
ncbi:AEC family transporter [Oligella urethralis]|uniref:AEC family transporter n=1 Tax=Oligella urethralis TaxID=90245 RepID=UPI000DF9E80A|nr:AEC family transporter [Oligella urethralis]SUA54980.1 putative transporter YfdV [Oligella urethralis]